jgi:hypothetical protein
MQKTMEMDFCVVFCADGEDFDVARSLRGVDIWSYRQP